MPTPGSKTVSKSPSALPLRRRRSGLHLGLHLLGLGLTVFFGGLMGIVLATIYPGNLKKSPWLDNFLVRSGVTEPTIVATASGNQVVAQELQKLQQDYQALVDRTTALEQAIGGQTMPGAPLPERFQGLAARIGAESGGLDIPIRGQQRVTLPSKLLFDGVGLRPESIAILAPVVEDLKKLPYKTILINTHSSAEPGPAISFQQAKSLREYLATQMGDRYRLVAIGYGNSRPISVNLDRVEIIAIP
jgi:outer membrane protein OmpA-like peptidoglycan-associated protein